MQLALVQGVEGGVRGMSEDTCMKGGEGGNTSGSMGDTFIDGGEMVGGEGRTREGGEGFCEHSLLLTLCKRLRGLFGGVGNFDTFLSFFVLFDERKELQRRLFFTDFLLSKGDEGEEWEILSSSALLGLSK